ncbi:hypothetical protein WALSEDRAFT_60660 [Wallemia mellicola CBS 633.66]|uniref:Actin-like ATPase domain-containing protein n=1 Tax=Wallemia mellicola (strain ATCC MYA-4683 / CBS 633.66) TaxID=671144 RepID=I4YAH7_WALMC|nr:hypothetical protein WALSEDRAFT_60660 [Wallemia mellicola CBS 633.66]EIM20969.1 hypothetical protein WALSEDRAFT_60660 [Wallemia mellicola CBS 633.66]|eukprot:XP_006958961.1 hypothetical protein WALSEDRAFT_60660 [Wallemia mellicola CBS 633.66]
MKILIKNQNKFLKLDDNLRVVHYEDTKESYSQGRLTNLLLEDSDITILSIDDDSYKLDRDFGRDITIYSSIDKVLGYFIAISPSISGTIVGLGEDNHVVFQIKKSADRQKLPPTVELYDHPYDSNYLLAYIRINQQGKARSSIRDAYCNGNWNTFNSLVNLINIGGSVGLDNKLFSFYYPERQQTLNGKYISGYYRYELGYNTDEFRDLRANPRCLIESQFLTIRCYIDYFIHNGFIDKDTAVYLTGETTQLASVVKLIADILHKTIYLPHSTIQERSIEHKYIPLLGIGLSDYFKHSNKRSFEELVKYRRNSYNHHINTPQSTPPLTPILTPPSVTLNTQTSKLLTPVDEQFELPSISVDEQFHLPSQKHQDSDAYILPDEEISTIYESLIQEHKRLEHISICHFNKFY